MNNSVKRYLAAVRRSLHCPWAAKREIVKRLQGDIADYLQDSPDPTYEELCLQFGVPEEYARESLGLYDAKSLNKEMRLRKKVLLLVSVLVVAALLVVSFIAVKTANFISRSYAKWPGYFVEEIVE